MKIVKAHPEELKRVEKQHIKEKRRWHYIYSAVDLAWEAAELLPDNDDTTAHVLCAAGSWIKAKYPEEADRFYKALVLRCRKTKLGQEADKLRWFPKVIEKPVQKL